MERSERVSAAVSSALMLSVTIASAGFVAAYLYIAIRRLPFAFDLEWMEGACLDHVSRLLSGRAVYPRPTLAFVPFFYPPAYYYVVAAVSRVFGVSLFSARLVSFVSSLVLLGILFKFVQRESRSYLAAALGVGLFAATYRLGGAWLDLARVNSLFLMLTLLGIYLLTGGRTRLSWVASGLVLAGAVLTKQTALLITLPIVGYVAVTDRRRGMYVAAVFAVALGAAVFALDSESHGWFLRYTVLLPRKLQALEEIPPGIWQRNIFGPLPWLWSISLAYILAIAIRDWRRALYLTVLLVSFVGGGWASGRHSGAYDDVFIPAHLVLCLIAAIAVGHLQSLRGYSGRLLHALACGFCALQLAGLTYSVQAQIPTALDAQRAESIHHAIEVIDGRVFVPQHGFVASAAGKPMSAHDWAVFDLLRIADAEDAAVLARDIHTAFETHRFAAIVIDKPQPWFDDDLNRFYRRDRPAIEDDALWTRTGYHTRPRWIYVPR